MDKKPDTAGDETFLGRWSRRKRAEPETREVEDAKVSTDAAHQRAASGAATQAAAVAPSEAEAVPADLPNVDELTPASDYRRFMQPDVPRASRNAAMKKLFTDPHFNVMDGLDTYIGDYTKEDPIPLEMLKDLAQSRMLKLFETNEDKSQENENSINEAPEAVVAQGPQTALMQEALQQPVSGPLLEQELADAINPPVITPALAPAPAHPLAHPPANAGGAKNQPGTGTMGAASSV